LKNCEHIISKARKTNVLVINVCNPLSLGGAAITLVLTNYLKDKLPDIKLTLMLSRERDQEIYQKKYKMQNVKFIPHAWYKEKNSTFKTLLYSSFPAFSTLLRCFFSKFLSKIGFPHSCPLNKYEVIIDLNSDALNEHYGIVFPLFTLFNLFIASLSGKPVIVSPCTIGSFKKPFMKSIARFVLNKMNIIMVREDISRKNLENLGVSKPKIVVGADLAFLFEPNQTNTKLLAGINLAKIRKPIVGFALSQEIHKYAFAEDAKTLEEKYEKYVKLMAEIVDFVIEKLDAYVILIPHSLSEVKNPRHKLLDDRVACRSIYEKVKDKHRVQLIEEHRNPGEIKALIGKCDLFIGCRMHSTIASTSLFVPTVALAYGEKFEGIIGDLMGQKDRVVRVNVNYKVLSERLKSKIIDTWEQKSFIKRDLQERLKSVQEIVYSSLFLMRETIEGEIERKEDSVILKRE